MRKVPDKNTRINTSSPLLTLNISAHGHILIKQLLLSLKGWEQGGEGSERHTRVTGKVGEEQRGHTCLPTHKNAGLFPKQQ